VFVTIREFAKARSLSYFTVYKWVRAGTLRTHRFGRSYRISAEDAAAFDAAHRSPPPEEDVRGLHIPVEEDVLGLQVAVDDPPIPPLTYYPASKAEADLVSRVYGPGPFTIASPLE
jgi:excisionase family DNA binding protein